MIHELQQAEVFKKGVIPYVLGAYPQECFRFTDFFLRMTFPNAGDLSEDEVEGFDITFEQPTEHPTEQVIRLVKILDQTLTRQELMDKLGLQHRPTYTYKYNQPAVNGKWVEMTIAQKPNDPNQ